MQIGIPMETRAGEHRVAATPETVKRLALLRHQVLVQAGAGLNASISDAAYAAAGATLVPAAALYAQADMVLKVRGPDANELAQLRRGTVLIGLLGAGAGGDPVRYTRQGLIAFALELLPRITRAQEMDVLSSQANIAGYKAVILAADLYQRFFPMLMTAAGTVRPARVLILGAGVAGLQAIATAKRLGAVIEAFDVRRDVKEQVESLGAKFIEVPADADAPASAAGGYAREMAEDYKRRQAALIHERALQADIVITTALIPGRPAPRLVAEETVCAMKPGSVIVDLAAEAGGNCALTQLDQIVKKNGVSIVGFSNLPSQVAADASALYARNVLNFVALLTDAKTGALHIDRDDEIIQATLLSTVDARAAGAK